MIEDRDPGEELLRQARQRGRGLRALLAILGSLALILCVIRPVTGGAVLALFGVTLAMAGSFAVDSFGMGPKALYDLATAPPEQRRRAFPFVATGVILIVVGFVIFRANLD